MAVLGWSLGLLPVSGLVALGKRLMCSPSCRLRRAFDAPVRRPSSAELVGDGTSPNAIRAELDVVQRAR